jgi:hypothetical protein
MNITIDHDSPLAPYEQVRLQIAAQAQDGTLAAGAKLPPVRQLATDLGYTDPVSKLMSSGRITRAGSRTEGAVRYYAEGRVQLVVHYTGTDITRIERVTQ